MFLYVANFILGGGYWGWQS